MKVGLILTEQMSLDLHNRYIRVYREILHDSGYRCTRPVYVPSD
jgi:hypothetical protein